MPFPVVNETVTFRLPKRVTARLRRDAKDNTRTISGELETILEKHFFEKDEADAKG